VSTLENHAAHETPLILSLLFTPVNLVYALFTRIFNLFSRIFPFLPRVLNNVFARFGPQTRRRTFTSTNRRPLGPQDTSARFIREFTQEYGATTLPFSETGYARAFDLAKRDLKFLLVIPLSMEHDATDAYVHTILLSPTVTSFLSDPTNNILLWAGTLADSETYEVASQLRISTFPSACLIAHTPAVSSTAMSVIARITGTTTPTSFNATLAAAMSQHESSLSTVRAARAEQNASRSIREQQDSAYERSLAADRARAQQRREAEAAAARREKEALERQEKAARAAELLEQWRRWRAKRVLPEPDKEDKTAVRIQLRLEDGERVIRRFGREVESEEVYAFVECFEMVRKRESGEEEEEKRQEQPEGFKHEYTFQLVSPMPREVYDLATGGKIGDRIGRSASLIVEKLVDVEMEEWSEELPS